MKFNFKLSNIEIAGINIGGIEIESEMTLVEVVGMRKEQEHVLENLTKYINQLGDGAKAFSDIEDKLTETYEELLARKTAERTAYFENLKNNQ